MKIDELRQQFMSQGLRSEDLNPDPIKQFEQWYKQTCATDIVEPGAMALATVDANGQPWQRMVLLKLFDEQGFVFFTNYTSRKAGHIEANQHVSLLFPWQSLGRQVKITGTARKIPTAESLRYFMSRPRGSQIGAWASPQSQVIKTRAMLDTLVDEMKRKFHKGDIPLPDFWGGYRVVPDTIEFWQARDNRLHDRFIYTLEAGQWTRQRLAP